MSVKVVSQKLGALIDPAATVERLATGFLFTEGPLWDHAKPTLYFSDMPGNVLRSWTESGGIREVRRPSDMSNGLTFDVRAGSSPVNMRHDASPARSATEHAR